MQLTEHQQIAHDLVIKLLKEGKKRIIIKGSAGTGKTSMVVEILKTIKKDKTIVTGYNNGHMYVTAPTNKALSVLQKKIDIEVDFKTIHSACRLALYIDRKTGGATFVRQKFFGKRKGDEFDFCKIAIVDEVSMLNSDFLGRWGVDDLGRKIYKQGYLDDFKFPIIYLGDPCQLSPVGESISPIWIKDYPVVELTEIIRQGKGNPIIELSRDLDLIYFKSPKLIERKGYIYSDNRQEIISDLAEVNGTDALKYLAYTNKEVDAINTAVRVKRYGQEVKRIEKDETIVFNTPMGSYYTNKEVKVEKVEIVIDYVFIPTYETRYDQSYQPLGNLDKIKMKYYRINNSFNVVHEDSIFIYNSIYNTLKENNKKYNWDGRGYHYFSGLFADITYNHALSIHKSQGSTYKEAIINIENTNYCRDTEEKQRLLYTAITRSSDLIILNNVK